MKRLLFLFLLLPLVAISQKTVTSKNVITVKDATGSILKTDSSSVTTTILPETITIHDTIYKNVIVYRDTCTSQPPTNKPPTANGGGNKTVTLPNGITLTATATDSDGTIASVKWVRVATGEILSTKYTLTLTFPVAGSYIYSFTATDDKGATASDQVTVTVLPEVVTPPGGTPIPLSFTPLTGDYSRPNAGFEYWYNAYEVSTGVTAQDRYIRFSSSAFYTGTSATPNSWSIFDQQINTAIDAKQKFSFGIMTFYPDPGGAVGIANYDGGTSAYPQYVHNQMQAEAQKDVNYQGDWLPNYNSPSYLTFVETMLKAIATHLETTSRNGVKYIDAINSIDIRCYGSWGEWHDYPYNSAVPKATTATLKRIIDAHRTAFPNTRLSAMIAGMGDGSTAATAEVSYYLLTVKNNAGDLGIRRDNWGATEAWWNQDIFENNPRTYNGVALKTLIMDKWKTAPITGEPCCNSGYAALPSQATKYHLSSVGNGNYGAKPTVATATSANKIMGYRLGLTSGSITPGTGSLSVTLNWSNSTGLTPVYEDFDVVYELRQGGNVVVASISSFKPKLVMGTKSVTDNFGSLPSGTYDLYLVVKNPSGYRQLPLNITGNKTGYLLKSGIVL